MAKEKRLLSLSRKKEKKANSPSKLRKDLDTIFSQYIRRRDKVCRKCGTNQNLQNSHIMSRVSQNLRWDERNAMTLCYKCHLCWWHKEILEAAEWCKIEIGEELYNSLRKEKDIIKHWTPEDLKNLIEKYSNNP